MTRTPRQSTLAWLLLTLIATAACGSADSEGAPPTTGGAGSAGAAGSNTVSGGSSSGAATGGMATTGGAGASSSAGTSTGGSSAGAGGSSAGAGGSSAGGGAGAAGASNGGNANGSGGAAAGGGGTGGSGGTVVIPPGCNLQTPVSFKQDVEPFLTASCGKGVGPGCHVTDGQSTKNSLCPDGTMTCGFDHAYDWITAGSHNEYCNQTPGPIRYTVVLDVMKSAEPASCNESRLMPPPGMGAPATACQLAALEAWLAQPKVLQVHRKDDTSPAEPYLMPPFN